METRNIGVTTRLDPEGSTRPQPWIVWRCYKAYSSQPHCCDRNARLVPQESNGPSSVPQRGTSSRNDSIRPSPTFASTSWFASVHGPDYARVSCALRGLVRKRFWYSICYSLFENMTSIYNTFNLAKQRS
jgi:hypothetical protein